MALYEAEEGTHVHGSPAAPLVILLAVLIAYIAYTVLIDDLSVLVFLLSWSLNACMFSCVHSQIFRRILRG